MISLASMSRLLNKVIHSDPRFVERCQAQQGKTVAIEVTDLNATFAIHINADGLLIERNNAINADTTITGSSIELIKVAVDPASTKNMNIRGNIELAQWVQRLAKDTRIDWEMLLAPHVGDIAAHQMVHRTKRLAGWLKQQWFAFKADAVDYVQEERDILAQPVMVEQFYQDIDTLRDDTDRLAARIARLKQQQESHHD